MVLGFQDYGLAGQGRVGWGGAGQGRAQGRRRAAGQGAGQQGRAQGAFQGLPLGIYRAKGLGMCLSRLGLPGSDTPD